MACRADPSLRRVVIGDFQFPLGVYPIEDMTPKAGYTVTFEQADGGGEGEWEEWPDRYAYEVAVSAERLPTLAMLLMSLFSGRVYPILDLLGQDAYREIDPYIAYELVGVDRVLDAMGPLADFFYEDGMCGFGAMSEEPFLYVFIDEHKIVTIRADVSLKERVERILHAFDLEQMEEVRGADSAAHEHRSVLLGRDEEVNVLTADEIVERLKSEWRLLLNVDPDTNVDDEGKELGTTHWRAVLRCEQPEGEARYAEILFDANSLRHAEEVCHEALERLAAPEGIRWEDAEQVSVDRLSAKQFGQVLADAGFVESKGESGRKKSRPSIPTGKSKRKSDAPTPVLSPEPGRVYVARWMS